jgi:hypothetical protein
LAACHQQAQRTMLMSTLGMVRNSKPLAGVADIEDIEGVSCEAMLMGMSQMQSWIRQFVPFFNAGRDPNVCIGQPSAHG